MDQSDQRNFLIAIVLTVIFLFAYQALVLDPEARKQREIMAAREQVQAEAQAALGIDAADGTGPIPVPAVTRTMSVEEALAAEERIVFRGAGVDGSIRLSGARLDDLSLGRHFVTVEREEEVRLLAPEASQFGYYSFVGWVDADNQLIAGANAAWQRVTPGDLTPTSPVTIRFERDGIRIDRVIAMDDDYMFTFTDTVTNGGGAVRILRPVSAIRRFGGWKEFVDSVDPGSSINTGIVHQGLIGVLDGKLKLQKYTQLQKSKSESGASQDGGWWGFTDKYWMMTVIPDQTRAFSAETSYRVRDGRAMTEATITGEEMSLAPGDSVTVVTRLYAGAKEVSVLDRYEDELAIPRFNDAVDWGRFYFMTKPFFWLLETFKGWVGGLGGVAFGVAILMLTVLVKAVFFPIQNKAYESMTKMKKLTEPMKEIRERFAADKQRQQQEIMKLYQKEKVNPLAGCLPILIQIPVFFALYKTLTVTIEMRHAPFFGWVNDLSAPDPTAIGNLFGLLGGLFTAGDVKAIPLVGAVLGVGLWPIMYGITMWGVQSLSPPPPDAMQRRIFAFMPLIFTFVFAGFAAGLVIYWTWSNLLSLLQQYVIMRRQGVETQLDKLIRKLRAGKAGADAS